MPLKEYKINWFLIIILIIVATALSAVALYRTEIDTDIVGSLPRNDPVISDARHILLNHPLQEQLAIDVSHQKEDPDILAECGELVEKKLRESGLFRHVGMKEAQHLIPELIFHILENLPVMFTEKELDDKIRPLLEQEQVQKKLEDNFSQLLNLEGIGQTELISGDPLGLRNFVLARLSHLAPSQNARIYKGHLISRDRRHLLVIAKPGRSGTDTTFARMVTELINNLSAELNQRYSEQGYVFTLTPVGAYRAALDNERIAKKDTQKAILFSTLGIAILLVFAFPRPVIGMLSLLPAIMGTVMAFFLCSLLYRSVSVMALGFGGAIISITVDHGIAYLLFLDRPHETRGKEAAGEVWAIGLLATLTTVGAFSTLSFSGFPILAQIGQFAALGIAFSFLFVHTIFPLIFPEMPPAKKQTSLPLQRAVNTLALAGGKNKAYAALGVALFMLCFAKPVWVVDLRAMNTVSEETKAAENLVSTVWGNIFSKIYLMTEGESVRELQKKGDRLAELLEQDVVSDRLASAFVPSMIFPGEHRGKQNLAAWKTFWDGDRVKAFKNAVTEASSDLGFAPHAFAPFYELIDKKAFKGTDIPDNFFDLLGISESRGSPVRWVGFSSLTPGSSYHAEKFYSEYSGMAKIFDPRFFSERLGMLLSDTFVKMVTIISASVVIILLLFFADWKLTFISLMPVIFAFICTLGTLRLIGHPLGLPGLMLSIVVMGMGIDYSLFFVRSYQRYMDESHPSLGLIRMAVFLASASSIIGFGVLSFADHALLRSAGLTSLIGITYSLIGAFVILPPVLKRFLREK